MRRKAHVRFGGRAEETDEPKGPHCASARPDHTAASLMINHGADPKLIQAQLGHSSITVTYDVYGHLFPDRLDELSTRLDDLIKHTHRDREPPELGIG